MSYADIAGLKLTLPPVAASQKRDETVTQQKKDEGKVVGVSCVKCINASTSGHSTSNQTLPTVSATSSTVSVRRKCDFLKCKCIGNNVMNLIDGGVEYFCATHFAYYCFCGCKCCGSFQPAKAHTHFYDYKGQSAVRCTRCLGHPSNKSHQNTHPRSL